MSILGIVGGVVGSAAGGPGGGAAGAEVGNNLPNILTNLFGGAGRDAQRQARCDWFHAEALAGSPLAFRVLLGGIQNTASHESPMYSKAVGDVTQRRPDVANAGYNAGGAYWDTTDNDSSDKMRAAVNAELASLDLVAVGSPGVTSLPIVQTSASSPTTIARTPAAVASTSSFSFVWLVPVAIVFVVIIALAASRRGGH